VIKALSEAAVLRRLPAGAILYEEHTRAEGQFVVLSGAVQVCGGGGGGEGWPQGWQAAGRKGEGPGVGAGPAPRLGSRDWCLPSSTGLARAVVAERLLTPRNLTSAWSGLVYNLHNCQERIRPRRDGAANRAALRSALKSAVAASRAKSAGRLRPGAAAAAADTRTLKQKIEDERKCE
jgi:hypothetical protein